MKIYNVIKASEYDGEYIGLDIIGSFTDKDAAIRCAENELDTEKKECELLDNDIYHTESSEDHDYFFQMWQVSTENYKFTIRIVSTEVEEPKSEGKDAIEDAMERSWKANQVFRSSVKEHLKNTWGEFTMDDSYGEEGELQVDVIDSNNSGVDHYALDKARYNAEKDCVEFHMTEYNYKQTDEWIASYWLGSEESFAMENINF